MSLGGCHREPAPNPLQKTWLAPTSTLQERLSAARELVPKGTIAGDVARILGKKGIYARAHGRLSGLVDGPRTRADENVEFWNLQYEFADGVISFSLKPVLGKPPSAFLVLDVFISHPVSFSDLRLSPVKRPP